MDKYKKKFSEEDKKYLTLRHEFANEIGVPNLFEFIDHFSLFVGTQTLGKKIKIYELLKATIDTPGHVVEFGTWKGDNLLFLAKILNILSPNSTKKVFGFDNFSGLPEPSSKDGDIAKTKVGKYRGDLKVLKHIIKTFGFENIIHLVVGDAVETIPDFNEKNPEIIVSFAYIDFDLYDPVKSALTFLDECLAKGGIIALDEANDPNWPGETLALKEFLSSSKNQYEMFSNNLSPRPTLILKKIS